LFLDPLRIHSSRLIVLCASLWFSGGGGYLSGAGASGALGSCEKGHVSPFRHEPLRKNMHAYSMCVCVGVKRGTGHHFGMSLCEKICMPAVYHSMCVCVGVYERECVYIRQSPLRCTPVVYQSMCVCVGVRERVCTRGGHRFSMSLCERRCTLLCMNVRVRVCVRVCVRESVCIYGGYHFGRSLCTHTFSHTHAHTHTFIHNRRVRFGTNLCDT